MVSAVLMIGAERVSKRVEFSFIVDRSSLIVFGSLVVAVIAGVRVREESGLVEPGSPDSLDADPPPPEPVDAFTQSFQFTQSVESFKSPSFCILNSSF